MSEKTEISLSFSSTDSARRAYRTAKTVIFVYYHNNYRYLPFDEMKLENADGWLHYPPRYVRREKLSAFRNLWTDYRLRHREMSRARGRDALHDDEAEQQIDHIRLEGRRLVIHDSDIAQNRLIENHYFEDFYSLLCFLLVATSPDQPFEGMCRSVGSGYAKRVLTHAVYDGKTLTFEQMEGDPVYGTSLVAWTLQDDMLIKRSMKFPFIRVELVTGKCDEVERDERLGSWIQRVNDVHMEMVSAELCFRHASFPYVMIYGATRAICEKYRDELLSLLADRNYRTRLFSILCADECLGTSGLVPDSVTKIGDKAFAGTTGLRRVELPDSVTEIGDSAFEECGSLEEVIIPDSVRIIESFAFHSCTNLKSIVLPGNLKKLMNGAFCACSALESIIIPDGTTEIGSYTFSRCTGLKTIVLPKKLRKIGEEAFKQCTSLESIAIPEHVETIGKDVFRGCSPTLVIYGRKGSEAERRAREGGFPFVEMAENVPASDAQQG